jgi:hypothetical protein
VNVGGLGAGVKADLIVQEHNQGGPDYDRPYLRLKMTHQHFAFCGMADGETSLSAFLILSNTKLDTTANGKFTIKTQSACARSITADITGQSTSTDTLGGTLQANVAGNGLRWQATNNAYGPQYKPGTGTIIVGNTLSGDCNGSGSYTVPAKKTDMGFLGWGLFYTQNPKSSFYPFRLSKEFTATCQDDVTERLPFWGGASGCVNHVQPGINWNDAAWQDDQHTELDLSCAGTGPGSTADQTLTESISGTATATSVIACGAWTEQDWGISCPVDGAEPASPGN